MKKYRHVFFDLDHTLWDFDRNSDETILELYEQGGFARSLGHDGADYLKLYRETNFRLWEEYRQGKLDKETLRIRRFRESFKAIGYYDEAGIRDFERSYLAEAPRKKALVDGALEILEALAERKMRLHIITNGFSETQSIKLKESGIAHFFDLVMTSDTLQVHKPEAAIFIESLKRSGAQRVESFMVGDSLLADVIGARQVGMDQAYYNPRAKPHEENITIELRSLSDLLPYLE